ncbi:hypothetical protein HZ326_31689 [Fusarium oxysporum f. sp. albedinis]|nr:hypothetical protein HZ326_31689 [Fusarium oxysporum f. sp. albedinis]
MKCINRHYLLYFSRFIQDLWVGSRVDDQAEIHCQSQTLTTIVCVDSLVASPGAFGRQPQGQVGLGLDLMGESEITRINITASNDKKQTG